MKWIIDGKEFEDAREAAEYITDDMSNDVYDDMLDECYGEIEICGFSYLASLALYRIDEIAYHCGRNDYYDSLASDIAYELERMSDGDTETFYDVDVECVDEEEEEEE